MTPLTSSLKKQDIECPKCWVKAIQARIDIFGPDITIDICPSCQGSWLDDGELQKLLKGRKLANHLTEHIGTKTKSQLVCPRCGGLMDIEKAEDIEVDVCLDCGGVWLDGGELKELKEKAVEGYEGDPGDKLVEKWEEHQLKRKNSPFNRFGKFLDRILGKR